MKKTGSQLHSLHILNKHNFISYKVFTKTKLKVTNIHISVSLATSIIHYIYKFNSTTNTLVSKLLKQIL
jgi:hypothetical protein